MVINTRLGKNVIERAHFLVHPRSCRLSLQMHRAIVLVDTFSFFRLTNQGEAWHMNSMPTTSEGLIFPYPDFIR